VVGFQRILSVCRHDLASEFEASCFFERHRAEKKIIQIIGETHKTRRYRKFGADTDRALSPRALMLILNYM